MHSFPLWSRGAPQCGIRGTILRCAHLWFHAVAGKGNEMRPSGVHSIVINTLYASGARLATIIARAVYVVVIANQLGPELYGLFNYGLSWYLLFVPLGIVGVDEIVVREIGRRSGDSSRVVEDSLALRLATGLLAAMASLVLGLLLDDSDPVRSLLLVFAVALFGRVLSSWSNAVFRGGEAAQYVLVHELGFRMLEVLAGLVLLSQGFGLLALAVVHAACWLLQGVASIAFVERRFHPHLRPAVHPGAVPRLLKAGLPLLASAFLLGWLVQGPVVLLRALRGDGEWLGQLALAVQVYALVGSVVAELGSAAIPVLTRSADRDDGKTRRFADAALRVGWLLSGLLTLGAIALGDWALGLLFDADYAAVGSLLPWTTLLVGMHFCSQALWGVLVARAHHATLVGAAFAGATVFTLAFPPAVGWLDLHGAFLALALGYFTVLVIQLRTLARADALDWRSASLRPLLAVALALLSCVMLMPVGRVVGLVAGLLVLTLFSLWLDVVSPAQVRRVLAARSR